MSAEIILFQSDNSIQLEVRMEDETVWLTLNQMSVLFDRDKSVISRHINSVFKEKELDAKETVAKNATVQVEGSKSVLRQIEYYNLDVIISVGYRVKSKRGTQFRIWANTVLKDYLMKGYAVNQRFERIEKRLSEHDEKIDFFVKTALPPVHGIFYDGQIFDAYKFISDIIKSAKKSIILIDNYMDESALTTLAKREKGVKCKIYTNKMTNQFKLDLQKFNTQYEPVEAIEFSKSHDRFLIINKEAVYHIGASLKDLGKKWFAFSKINLDAAELIKKL